MFKAVLMMLVFLLIGACSPDVPSDWVEFVPIDGLEEARSKASGGSLETGVSLVYDLDDVELSLVWDEINDRFQRQGFERVLVCPADSEVSESAGFVHPSEGMMLVSTASQSGNIVVIDIDSAPTGISRPTASCRWQEAATQYCDFDWGPDNCYPV